MKHLFCITTTLLCLLWTSCGHKRDIFEGAELTPQHVRIERFDSAFIHVDTTHIDASVEQLYTRYPDFTPYFVSELLGLPNKDSLAAILPRFLADTTLRIAQTNRDEQQLFADISLIQKELDEAKKKLKVPVEVYPAITKNPPRLLETDMLLNSKLIRPGLIEAVFPLAENLYMVSYFIMQKDCIIVCCCLGDLLDFVKNGVEQQEGVAVLKKHFRKKYPYLASLYDVKPDASGK